MGRYPDDILQSLKPKVNVMFTLDQMSKIQKDRLSWWKFSDQSQLEVLQMAPLETPSREIPPPQPWKRKSSIMLKIEELQTSSEKNYEQIKRIAFGPPWKRETEKLP